MKTPAEKIKEIELIRNRLFYKLRNYTSKEIVLNKFLKNVDKLVKLNLEQREKEIFEKAKEFNGQINTTEELFEHMKRLQLCTICKKDFYDKWCPECIDKHYVNKKEILEIIENLPNPYPTDIFPEINQKIFEEINKELQKKFKFPLDRLSAELMRRARNNLKEDIIKEIKEGNQL